jgi:hypothetical protein
LKQGVFAARIAFMDNGHDDKLEEKLEKLTKIVEEDHKMIKGVYTRMRISSAFRIIYWALIILAALGAYVWVRPYIDSFKEAYDSVNQYRTSITGKSGFFSTMLEKWFGTSTPQ